MNSTKYIGMDVHKESISIASGMLPGLPRVSAQSAAAYEQV
jgi:hypothetical protein